MALLIQKARRDTPKIRQVGVFNSATGSFVSKLSGKGIGEESSKGSFTKFSHS